jgi:hypothetical protein
MNQNEIFLLTVEGGEGAIEICESWQRNVGPHRAGCAMCTSKISFFSASPSHAVLPALYGLLPTLTPPPTDQSATGALDGLEIVEY